MPKPSAASLLLTILALGFAACHSGHATAPTPVAFTIVDPALAGPYAVGLRKMTFTRPSNADGSPRVMETWVWYPADGPATSTVRNDAPPASAGGLFPVVVFSHGSGGEPWTQTFLTEHLASWGFVVAAPPHPGNTSADCVLCDTQNVLASARERPTDVTYVLDQLLALRGSTDLLGKAIDPDRTVIAGHSFGGWTAMFVAGSGRFKAAVALAPGLPDTLLARVSNLGVPVLLMGGGKDELVAPDSVRRLFDAIPASDSKTYVFLPSGHHLTFIDRCLGCTDALPEARGHELTNRFVTAFLETYVVGDARYREYLSDVPPDASVVR